MISKSKFLIFKIVLIFLCTGLVSQKPTVIVISLDGFRWDYPDKTHLPVFDSLQIVANKFYDPETDRHYRIGDRTALEDAGFYAGEPIWVTAEKQGVVPAFYYWMGSEATVKGIHPSYWKKYAEKVPFQARADTVNLWLKLPEGKRPQLVIFYSHESDGAGHRHVPDKNPRTLDIILVADRGWTIRHHQECSVSKGAHGYDPDNKNMRAIFFASGPAFKEGFRCSSFENVDIYPLIAHLLGIVPASMDGQFDRVIEILKD